MKCDQKDALFSPSWLNMSGDSIDPARCCSCSYSLSIMLKVQIN